MMVPAFTSAFEVLPPPHLRPPRNGFNYDNPPAGWSTVAPVYTPDASDIDAYLGVIPRTVLAMNDRIRGRHAYCPFAAVGPLAHALIDEQTAEDVYAPFRVMAEHGGSVVMMGVGLTSLTLIHWAEAFAGRQLFRRWALVPAIGANGGTEVQMFLVGGCSNGFAKLEPAIGSLAGETRVGESRWRAFPARRTVDAATEAIRRDPEITSCGASDCSRCIDSVAGGPIIGNETA